MKDVYKELEKLTPEQQQKAGLELLHEIQFLFRSGNIVPVERVTLRSDIVMTCIERAV